MQIAEFMSEALQMNESEKRKLLALYRSTGIQYRHTVLGDYTRKRGEFVFYSNTPDMEPFPAIANRMELYRQNAVDLCQEAIVDCLKSYPDFDLSSITHLITVSCTGMYAPGIDIELVDRLQLPSHTQRTAINFMGCYAAFNALKAANAICKAFPESKVLIVCVELCTIHFQKYKTEDHLISNSLFADGAAAVLIQTEPRQSFSLSIDSIYCDLIPAGKTDMAWHISNFGFEMTLSSYIPNLIKNGISELIKKLLQNLSLSPEDIQLFAIHPGGRRILEVIEEQMRISREDNRFAYHVLKNYGNMSSPTVLFVMKALWNNLEREDAGKHILSLAFGPGLTLESMLLKVHYQ